MNNMKGKPHELLRIITQLDKEKTYEIKEVRKKRSLDSNAYAWTLITEIGNVLRKSKEQVYLEMLKEYSQIIEIKVPLGCKIDGLVKYYDLILENDREAVYRVYKPSSEFNSKEMSIFIDGIVEEAKNLDIETRTPDEIAHMNSLWRG